MEKIREAFKENDLYPSRMISYSKSLYRDKFPENEVYFNANIFVLGEGKVWHGDLDVTMDRNQLSNVAKQIGKPLFILRELDGRFENENLKDSEIIKRAVCKIDA